MKKADERNMGAQAKAAFAKGKPKASVELGELLKKAGDVLAADWAKMSDEKKAKIRESLYSAGSGDVAWDFEQMFKTEDSDYFATESTKGTIFRQFASVNGEVHFIGAINYYLWGRLNRLMFDDEMQEEKVTNYLGEKFKYDDLVRENGEWKRPDVGRGASYYTRKRDMKIMERPAPPEMNYSLEPMAK